MKYTKSLFCQFSRREKNVEFLPYLNKTEDKTEYDNK